MNIPWVEHFVSNDSRFIRNDSFNGMRASEQLVDQESKEDVDARVVVSTRDSRIAA